MITWKQNLKKLSRKDYEMLKDMCYLSKSIYNEALYNIRQQYFSQGEYLKYEANYHLMKDSIVYKTLGSAISQQTMRCADDAFKSFFALLRLKCDTKFSSARVNLPHYLPKDGLYPLHIPQPKIKDKHFIVSTSPAMKHKYNHVVRIRIPDKLLNKKIRQIHIIPKYKGNYFEVRYIFDEPVDSNKYSNEYLDQNKFLGIDFGVNNFATCATSEGDSFIIDGRKVKSINQWYNKELARLSSIKDHQNIKGCTKKQYLISQKRNNRIKDFIYCASKYIINYCLKHNISTIVVGYNDGFQENPNLGKVNNQNFVMLPYGQFKNRLRYLAEQNGINFVLQEESYTSKASFFDNDVIPIWNPRNPKQGSFSGKRIHRGLYKTSKNQFINADVNAALNIIRKSNLTDLTVLQSRGKVMVPLRIKLA